MEFVLQRPDELLENKSKSLPLEISLYRAERCGVAGSSELASYPRSLGLRSITSPQFVQFPLVTPLANLEKLPYNILSRFPSYIFLFNSLFTIFPFDTTEPNPAL
jgi:hypothetical protein